MRNQLSEFDLYLILDAAAQFTTSAHIAANQCWSNRQDLIDYLLTDHIPSDSHDEFLSRI